MRKLGLTIELTFVAALAATGCTRAANSGSVPPPGSDSSAGTTQPVPSAAPSSIVTPAPSASATATAVGDKAYDDSTKAITAKVGERFTLNLPANITTPYKWVLASPETNVTLAERHYQEKPPEGCSGCVGYPGTDRLTFEAKQPGDTKLILRYAPLRSKEPAERELTITVTVVKP
jgi:predicted secreted protein